jgi:hypothetical protein
MEQEKRGFIARSDDSIPNSTALDIYVTLAGAETLVCTS